MTIRFYDNAAASAPIRIRIVLLLKGIPHERVPVEFDFHRTRPETASYQALNPQAMIPAIVDGDFVLWQSLAIAEYLDERFPHPPIMPGDPRGKARVRSLSAMIACDAQPLVNFRVRELLRRDYGLAESDVLRWVRHWIAETLQHYEQAIAAHPDTGRFSHGDGPTMADAFLFPHVLHAKRFGVPLAPYPTIVRVFAECLSIPAFRDSQPAPP